MKHININKIFVLLFFLLGFSSCSVCETNIIETKISPDNKYKAIVFERACGATTGFNRHVLISSEKEPKLKKGNVLIINGNEVEVFWITSDVIRIKYLGKEVFKTDYINEIKIEYD